MRTLINLTKLNICAVVASNFNLSADATVMLCDDPKNANYLNIS